MKFPASTSQTPRPYAGQELDRRAHLGRPHTASGYGSDQSGDRTYRFNSLGFRGPEFDPGARYRVYGFGESHAFGYFVEAEECWPARFAALWTEAQDLSADAVCFQNFADVGASNAGIARAVITQCSAAPPDLVLVHFSEHRRGEVYLEERPHRIGPWLLEEATAQAAPAEEPLRSAYLRQIERGRHFYQYAVGPLGEEAEPFHLDRDGTCLEDTLRSLLLVQWFCQARGLTALATCDLYDSLFNETVRSNTNLGPLLAQVDPNFLVPLRIWNVDGDLAGDASHAGPQRHDRFARELLRILQSRPVDPPPEPAVSSEVAPALPEDPVRRFYDRMPFNHWGSVEAAVASTEDPDALAAYPDLQALLEGAGVHEVIDAGCGGGWLVATLARHYPVRVTGFDFSSSALRRAQAVVTAAGVADRVVLHQRDLLTDPLTLENDAAEGDDDSVDLVTSLGVLHHTADPRRAFERLRRRVRVGGHLYLGLYHAPGRRVFLDHFHRLVTTEGEAAALAEFRRLAADLAADDEHSRSWFRDQVLHPRESLHTLREVVGWLDATGCELVSTSINRFAEFDTEGLDGRAALFALEDGYAERSRQALAEGRFFPGFFTVMARRVA